MVAVPLARGDDVLRQVGVRIAAIALLALVAGVVLGWSLLVPVSLALAAGLYAAELAGADAPLDVAVPAVAAGLLLCAELAYWSLEERIRWHRRTDDVLRCAAVAALLAAAAFLVATVLLALVDTVRARGLALDLLGALAAVTVLATVLAVARMQRQPSNGS